MDNLPISDALENQGVLIGSRDVRRNPDFKLLGSDLEEYLGLGRSDGH